MKKLIIIGILGISVTACKQEAEKAVSDPHQFGFNYDSTAQMDAVKATFKDVETNDTSSYVTKYADSVKFHDNNKLTNLTDNINMQKEFIAAGVKLKLKDDFIMWSSHFDFKNGTQGDYVYTYVTATFSKDDKSVDIVMFQADKFNKDGKIIEEWMVYDQSNLASILN
jgi:hypothetical protein